MKYSILGFNQKAVLATTKIVHKTINGQDKLVPLKLDVTDLLILQHLADFPNRKKIIKTIIDDKMFFWVDYKTLIEELPILDIKKQALSDRLSKLVELGVVEKNIISHNGYGNSTFFRMGEKYESLKYSKEDEMQYESEKEECSVQPMVADYERVSYSTTKGYRSQLQDNNNIINNNTTNNSKENIDNKLSISKKKEKFCFKQSLIDLGVNENVAESFMVVRKNKKATNTEIAFNAIKKQIEKSGISANECITICVENSWKGFNAEWINNLNRSNNVNNRQSNTSQQFQDNRRLLKIGISYEANGELHLVDGTTFKNNHRYYVARDYKEYSIPVNAPERPDERFEYRNGEGWYLPYDLENADDMVW